MKTKSSPSRYRYCIVRLSTVAVSTLVPALKVLSTTFPESTFLSVVRTNAPPLPGLTCWNSTTDHSSPSRLSTRPFFRSLVVAMSCLDRDAWEGDRTSLPAESCTGPIGRGHRGIRLLEQTLGRSGEDAGFRQPVQHDEAQRVGACLLVDAHRCAQLRP